MIADAGDWATSAVIHIHVMSPYWPENRARPPLPRIRTAGNVAFLPAPVAGYRIRHAATGVIVEIKPSHAPATELAQCADIAMARAVLAQVSEVDRRPFLGEIGRAA